jgi:hypothetical protein
MQNFKKTKNNILIYGFAILILLLLFYSINIFLKKKEYFKATKNCLYGIDTNVPGINKYKYKNSNYECPWKCPDNETIVTRGTMNNCPALCFNQNSNPTAYVGTKDNVKVTNTNMKDVCMYKCLDGTNVTGTNQTCLCENKTDSYNPASDPQKLACPVKCPNIDVIYIPAKDPNVCVMRADAQNCTINKHCNSGNCNIQIEKKGNLTYKRSIPSLYNKCLYSNGNQPDTCANLKCASGNIDLGFNSCKCIA